MHQITEVYTERLPDRIWGRYPARVHQVAKLSQQIRPLVRFARNVLFLVPSRKGDLYFIKPVDPFEDVYTLDPEPAAKARGLKELCVITTYHSYSNVNFFKPSIAEVLAQIPAEHLEKVSAFEIVRCGKKTGDLDKHSQEPSDGYHTATTKLYGYQY